MPRPNRRGRYYNYPNLRAEMNNAPSANMSQSADTLQSVTNETEAELTKMGEGTYDRGEMSADDNLSGNVRQEEGSCRVRFFNAAAGYGDLSVRVANEDISSNLAFGGVTEYISVPDGFQLVEIKMVSNPDEVLLNKRIPFRNCMNTTAAIINTSTGIEVMMINDMGCRSEEDRACFRVANLSYTSPPLDIVLENGNPVFEDIRFKYVTEYKQAVDGEYNFNVMLARTAETLKSDTMDTILPEIPQEEGGYPGEDEMAYAYFFEDFEPNRRYTAYIIGNKDYEPPLRVETLVEED